MSEKLSQSGRNFITLTLKNVKYLDAEVQHMLDHGIAELFSSSWTSPYSQCPNLIILHTQCIDQARFLPASVRGGLHWLGRPCQICQQVLSAEGLLAGVFIWAFSYNVLPFGLRTSYLSEADDKSFGLSGGVHSVSWWHGCVLGYVVQPCGARLQGWRWCTWVGWSGRLLFVQ